MDFIQYTLYNSWKDFPKQVTIENVLALVTYLGNAPISALVVHFDNSLGDVVLGIENHPNLVVYPGVSDQLASIVHGLLNTRDIVLKRCNDYMYYLVGTWPQMPRAYTLENDEDFTQPYWLPCCLCPSLGNQEKWKEALEKGIEEIINVQKEFEKTIDEAVSYYVNNSLETLENWDKDWDED